MIIQIKSHRIELTQEEENELRYMQEHNKISEYDHEELKVNTNNRRYQIGYNGDEVFELRHKNMKFNKMLPIGNFKLESC